MTRLFFSLSAALAATACTGGTDTGKAADGAGSETAESNPAEVRELEEQIRESYEEDGHAVESIDLAPNDRGFIEGSMYVRIGGALVTYDCSTEPPANALEGFSFEYECRLRE